jgi:polyisoprenoid-binding protein YceI
MLTAKSGKVSFFSSAPLEDIEATNQSAQSVINTNTKEVAVKIPIKAFKFDNSLMQEHFNENYMESEKFPHATFKGKINEEVDLTKEGIYQVSATGKMNIHGVERDQTIKGKLQVAGGKAILDSSFEVLLVDYKIEVPTVVFQKIAEKIKVSCLFTYLPYIKQ